MKLVIQYLVLGVGARAMARGVNEYEGISPTGVAAQNATIGVRAIGVVHFRPFLGNTGEGSVAISQRW